MGKVRRFVQYIHVYTSIVSEYTDQVLLAVGYIIIIVRRSCVEVPSSLKEVLVCVLNTQTRSC